MYSLTPCTRNSILAPKVNRGAITRRATLRVLLEYAERERARERERKIETSEASLPKHQLKIERETMMFSHEKLDVYQRAIEFLAMTANLIEGLPRGNASLADQLKRASLSISSNIAEGEKQTKTTNWRC